MLEAESHRIGADRCRDVVHQRLDGKDVRVAAERAQSRGAVGKIAQNALGDVDIWNGVERHGIAVGTAATRQGHIRRRSFFHGNSQSLGGDQVDRAAAARARYVRLTLGLYGQRRNAPAGIDLRLGPDDRAGTERREREISGARP